MFHFIKAIFDNSFKLSRPFFGKWKLSVQMVDATPERNLPVLIYDNDCLKQRQFNPATVSSVNQSKLSVIQRSNCFATKNFAYLNAYLP